MLYDDDKNKKIAIQSYLPFTHFCPISSPRMRSAYTGEKSLHDEIKLCLDRWKGVNIIFVMCHQSLIHAYM